ncbi:MAG: DNA polymerase III subunit gamma/tau [Eggerthellaceae bacterium]|nr:DNA polymerase III subunit gamma/tau [Eggerthellaceae bacterium]
MMAEALYRKYRPQVFDEVVGQNAIERTLRNAIDQDKVSHAYLFCGPRGTGKTTTARLLAKALLCENGPTSTPDGTCEDCELIAAGEHPDVYELDAASRTGVENVREEIIGRVQFAPTRGKRKIYIIDEVHMLSTAAFNALLKTLEEPPSHVVFILCTTDPQKVPETIHSRCQRFDFRRIAHEAIVSRLGAVCMAEGVEFEGEALDLVAHRAEGGMRNALTALEQLIAYEGGKVTLEGAESLLGSIASSDMVRILQAIGTRDAVACFTWVADFLETGSDLAQFVRDLAERVRDLYVLSLAGESVSLEINEETRQELVSVLPLFGADRLTFLMGVLGDTIADLKTSTNPRLSFEIALTRMIRPQTDLSLEALAARIEALEAGYAAMPTHAIPEDASAAQRAVTGVDLPVEKKAPAVKQEAKPVDAVASDQAAVKPVASVSKEQDVAQVATRAPKESEQPVTVSSASNAKQGAYDLTNPAALQRFWQAALALIKKEKAAYHVLLLNTKPTYDAQTASLTIGFPAESEFAFKAFQKPEASSVVEKAIAQAFAAPLSFAYTQLPKEASRGAASFASQPVTGSVATPVRAENTKHNDSAVTKVSLEVPTQQATVNPAANANPPIIDEAPSFDDDIVPLDAYGEWSPEPSRFEDVSARQAEEPDNASQDELEDLKDALSLFGDGVMIEQWN